MNVGVIVLSGCRSGTYLRWGIRAGLTVRSQYSGRVEQSNYIRVNDGTRQSTGLFHRL